MRTIDSLLKDNSKYFDFISIYLNYFFKIQKNF